MVSTRSSRKHEPPKTARKTTKKSKVTSATVKKASKSNRTSQETESMQLGAIVKPLLAIGPLIRGSVVCRPSKTIRSPYVADVKLADGSTVIAHTPALDVGGLMSPGAEVWMKVRPPGGKTSHSVELVTCKGPECGPEGKALVGAHPRLAELVTKKVREEGGGIRGGGDKGRAVEGWIALVS
jgi:hypothetical protein